MTRIKEVTVRHCNNDKADSSLLLKIHNSSVEAGYFNAKIKVSKKDHEVWFQDKITNANTFIYIGQVKDQSFGYVRFDLVSKKHFEISIGNLPSKYGKGLGSLMLIESIKKFKKTIKPLLVSAVVKKFNERSLRCFLKSKFQIIDFKENKHLTINNFSKKKDYYLELKQF